MRTVQCTAVLGGSLLLTAMAGGCSDDQPTGEDPGRRPALAAMAAPGVVPWTLSSGQLRICFKNPGPDPDRGPALSVADFSTASANTLNALNGTWGNVPGLHFVSGCTRPAMTINLYQGDGTAGQCGLGNGSSCWFTAGVTRTVQSDLTAVHEVGHGLGLFHEHQRPDAGPLCPAEQSIMNGCSACQNATCTAAQANACYFSVPADATIAVSAADKATAISRYGAGNNACLSCSTGRCRVGACSAGTCTPNDSYRGCFGRNPQAGTVSTTQKNRDDATGRVDDRKSVNGVLLTSLYDPVSIMSYCRAYNGRDDAVPTQFDMLGMEMLYPSNRSYGLGCGTGCFATASGLLTSATGTIVSEWIARGSVGVPFRVSGASSDVYSYSVGALAEGTAVVSYTFRSPFGKALSGQGTVMKSNSTYAALASVLATIN